MLPVTVALLTMMQAVPLFVKPLLVPVTVVRAAQAGGAPPPIKRARPT